MIREIDELRRRGQVCRRVDGLAESLEQWRARVRAAARRDGLAIRTFVIDVDDSDTGNLTPQLVFAVRTDRHVDLRELGAAIDDAAELHACSTISGFERRSRRLPISGPAAPAIHA